jgi:serine/threonine protein kinase
MIVKKRAMMNDIQGLSEKILNNISTQETILNDLIKNETKFLQNVQKELIDLNQPNKKFERLKTEVQEKLHILSNLEKCDLDEKDLILGELIDKDKSISNCCKKIGEENVFQLNENTCMEYEIISKLRTLQNFSKKIHQFASQSVDDLIHNFQFYFILYMTSDFIYPNLLDEIEDYGCRDFLLHCVHVDPSYRYTIDQLLQHPWLTS